MQCAQSGAFAVVFYPHGVCVFVCVRPSTMPARIEAELACSGFDDFGVEAARCENSSAFNSQGIRSWSSGLGFVRLKGLEPTSLIHFRRENGHTGD